MLVRSYSGSIFSYYGKGIAGYNSGRPAYADGGYTKTWSSRAVVVVGEGL